MDCRPSGSSAMGILQARILEQVACLPPGDLPNPGIQPRSPSLWVDSLSSEPSGKPKNTEVGSLFLLQGIFLSQESNQGLLHCRQILYQLSYQECPSKFRYRIYFLAFPPSRSHLYSLAQGPFSIFRASSVASSNLTFSLPLLLPLSP